MAKYKRTTRDYWEVQLYTGPQYGWELASAASTLKEAREAKRDYQENQDLPVRIVKKREKIDARNTADALIFNLEKQMREHDSKINDAVKKKVNTKMNDLREVLKKDDASADDIKKATEALATEAQEIGKLVYEEAQKKAKEESAEKQDKDGPIDAEVVDEKEEDKKGKKKK
jgi:molecular chaperone DnaK